MNKKDLIIESAIYLFQKKGMEQTTVSDIVKRAKIAQGTFYLYFPSKLSLMPAIAEEMVKILVARINKQVNKDQSFDEQIINIIDSIFFINKQYSEVLAMIYAGLASTEHLKQWESVYDPCYSLISELLEDAKRNEKIKESIDSRRTAKLMIGLIESAAEQVYLYDYSNDEEVENQKKAVITFLFNALKITD